jgi:protein-tyrosine phosphatase
MKVLMVCLGNICRSPIAEAVFRDECSKAGLKFKVDSAGTANYHVGKAPDKRMISTAAKFGIDISQLRARQFSSSDFDEFDLIFAMDDQNFKDLHRLAKNDEQAEKLHRFQDFAGVDSPNYVPDPYYGDMSDFEFTFKVVRESALRIANKLKSKS